MRLARWCRKYSTYVTIYMLLCMYAVYQLIHLPTISSYRQLSNNSSKTEGRKEERGRAKKCPKERWAAEM